MSDEKTMETRRERKDRLRSLLARLQCARLLRRYRIRRTARHRLGGLSQRLRAFPVVTAIGETLYALGFSAEYAAVRFARGVRTVALFVWNWLIRAGQEIAAVAFPGAKQAVRDLFGPIYLLVRSIVVLTRQADRVRRQEGFGAAARVSGRYLKNGIRRNLRLLPRMAMYVLPLCMLVAGVAIFDYVMDQPYALAVQVNGETVGYVANEDVFNAAREDVQERISFVGTNRTEWTVEPSYTLSVAKNVLTENEMANAILRSSSDEISEGTALYLDGELTAVCEDGAQLRSYISGLLEPFEDEEDTDVTVGFNKEVTMEEGLYFNECFEDENDIEQMISGVQQAEKIYTVKSGDTLWGIAQSNGLTFKELCALNTNFKGEALTENSYIREGDELIVTRQEAMLEVRITKIETTQEEIAYTTETTKSSEYDAGTEKVTQEGENGLRNVTTQNVYDANGNLLEQTVISTEVVKEPVTKKVTVGTKKKSSGAASYITGSGTFIWPVPGYRYCSRWYTGSHRGVDICAAAGTPIYASAGGTVTKAGYNKAGAGTGYGYSVIISHSNGYTTVYAHCLSLVVSAGQSVRQGQLIGYVGSTGRSSGNHCHFEIRRNGSYIPPQNVFNRSSYR